MNTKTTEAMSKSSLTKNKQKKTSDSPSSTAPMSFLLLPYDVVLNCLSRISRILHPTLSLVSKSFRSLLASSELDATRSHIGKIESFLYVCLTLSIKNPNPSWFILAPTPKQQKLIRIPSFPYEHSCRSTVLSIGSEIYIIGGYLNERRSNGVFVLDCRSHQWRKLQEMHVGRVQPAADVINGKIYVIGGCKYNNSEEDWGEVYDPKTQKWEPLSPKTLDLTIQKSVVPGCLVMGGKVYCDMDGLFFERNTCLVEIENIFCKTWVSEGVLKWYDQKERFGNKVKGLEGLQEFPHLHSVAIFSEGASRVKVWWMSVKDRCHGCHRSQIGECKTEIWCAEVSLERRSREELWGFVEWSKNVLILDGCESPYNFFLHSAMVTL